MSAKCYCVGNLTRDPELRDVGNTSVVGFTVAASHLIKGRDGRQDREEVAFIKCEAWDTAAKNIAANFKQGDGIVVSGRLRTETWEDKETHKKRSNLILRVEDFGKRIFTPKSAQPEEVDEEEAVPF